MKHTFLLGSHGIINEERLKKIAMAYVNVKIGKRTEEDRVLLLTHPHYMDEEMFRECVEFYSKEEE